MPRAIGDHFQYQFTLQNRGGTSRSTTLTVNLPAHVSYQGANADRGSGCTDSRQVVTCQLGAVPAGSTTTVVVNVTLGGTGTLTLSASTSSSPADARASDGSASLSIRTGGSAPAPVPLKPPTAPIARLIVSALHALSLHAKSPAVQLHLSSSRATSITVTLLDAKGHRLAGWSRRVKAGKNTLKLVLPGKAKHRGSDRLKIVAAGSKTAKILALRLVA